MWSILSVFLFLLIYTLFLSIPLSVSLFLFAFLPPPYIYPPLLLLFLSHLSLFFTFILHPLLLFSPLSQICYFKFFHYHLVSKPIFECFSTPHISLISQTYFYVDFSLIRYIYFLFPPLLLCFPSKWAGLPEISTKDGIKRYNKTMNKLSQQG